MHYAGSNPYLFPTVEVNGGPQFMGSGELGKIPKDTQRALASVDYPKTL